MTAENSRDSRYALAQFVAGFTPGDAITAEALNIQRILGGQIYSWPPYIEASQHHLCKSITEFTATTTDLLIYHCSIGSPLTEYVQNFRGKKAMMYHNLTPSHYFRDFNPKIAHQLEEGRNQLAAMTNTFDLVLAVSEFNAKDLKSLGYRNIHVIPYLFDPSLYPKTNPDSKDGLTTILFVGRLAPNKKAEDLLKTFRLYQRFYNPQSRLIWVGSWSGLELYYLRLRSMIDDLKLMNVTFTGHVSPEALVSHYQSADLFVSTSEHEGFCVPILESFHYGKPVLAFAAGGIPETVGEAGILIDQRDCFLLAQAIDGVLTSPDLSNRLVSRGHSRLHNHFSLTRNATLLKNLIEEALPC